MRRPIRKKKKLARGVCDTCLVEMKRVMAIDVHLEVAELIHGSRQERGRRDDATTDRRNGRCRQWSIKSGEARGIGGSWEDLPVPAQPQRPGAGTGRPPQGMTMTMHSHKLTVV